MSQGDAGTKEAYGVFSENTRRNSSPQSRWICRYPVDLLGLAPAREILEPGAGQVRIMVQACGSCQSDVLTLRELPCAVRKSLLFPGAPKHELVGSVSARLFTVVLWRDPRSHLWRCQSGTGGIEKRASLLAFCDGMQVKDVDDA